MPTSPTILASGGLSLLVLAAICWTRVLPDIECEVEGAVARELASFADLGVAAEVSGRDVHLRGALVNEDRRAQVRAALERIPAVRRVFLDVAQPLPSRLTVRPEGDLFVLEGELPDAPTRQAIFQAAESAFGTGNVIDESALQPGLLTPAWLPSLPDIFANLAFLGGVALRIDGQTVLVQGRTSSKAYRVLMGYALERQFDGLRVQNAIDLTEDEVAQIAQAQADEILEAGVPFARGSADLLPEARPVLERLHNLLVRFPETRLEIFGHTDSTGAETRNRRISKRRAETVRSFLSTAIPAERMITVGLGSSEPIEDNSTPAGRAANRRIELRILRAD